MKYPTTLIIAALFCRTTVATPEQVTCDSPCDCHNAHGKGRWSVKTDASLPPTDASAIQAVTSSEMFGWPGPDADLTIQSERTGIENKWFALTGRVVQLKVEEGGDLHIALHSLHASPRGGFLFLCVGVHHSLNSLSETRICRGFAGASRTLT
jgi:hypothetical protein